MKKIALALFSLLLANSAFAADNAVIVTPGVGVTMKSKDIGAGVQAMQPILSDASGNVLLTTLGADAVSNTLTGIPVYSRQLFFNGTTWDRWQGAIKAASGAFASGSIASGAFASGSIGSGAIASGAVASGAVASGAYASGSIASGAMVDLGSQADAACGTDTGTCSAIALIKRGNQTATTTATNTAAAIPAGTASIGQVGSDPSSGKATPTFTFLALPATTTTQIVALSGTKLIYVTSLMAFGGGTVNVTFKYGTGSNCGTGTTTLAGPYPLTAQAGFALGSGTGPVMIVPSAQALCITTDASVSGGVQLTYQQI